MRKELLISSKSSVDDEFANKDYVIDNSSVANYALLGSGFHNIK